MTARRLASLSSLLSLCVACQTAFAAPSGAGPGPVSSPHLLPPAERPLELRVGDPQVDNLEHLLAQLGEATGVEFTIDAITRQQLRGTATGLAADIAVPAEEAWRWVEGLLAHNRFQLGAVSLRPPYLVGVYGTQQRSDQPRPRPAFISSHHLDVCTEHPAFLFYTVLDLPHVDVRQLGNSLRALVSDPSGAQAIIPVGNTSTLILSGEGAHVAQLAEMLRLIEETAAEAWERGEAYLPAGQRGDAPAPAVPGKVPQRGEAPPRGQG